MQTKIQKVNKSNRNGIYLIKDADEFLNVMGQLRKEYLKKNGDNNAESRFEQ